MEITRTEEPTRLVALVRSTVRMDELPAFFDRAYRAVPGAVAGAGGAVQGPAIGWYRGMPTDTVDLAAGFPVTGLGPGPVGTVDDGVEVVEMPGGPAVAALHVGSYDGLPAAWQQVAQWQAANAGPGRGDFWEEYLTEPAPDGDPSRSETRLVVPLR